VFDFAGHRLQVLREFVGFAGPQLKPSFALVPARKPIAEVAVAAALLDKPLISCVFFVSNL